MANLEGGEMLRKKIRNLLLSIALFWLAALACNSPQSQDTPDIAAVVARTQTAQALAVFLSQTSPAQSTTAVSRSATPAASTTPAFTATTAPPTSTPTLSITQPPNCTNSAKFEGETVPDDSPVAAAEPFTKTWTLRNTGTCAWTPDYALVFNNGEQMSGHSPAPLGQLVAPNATAILSVALVAPGQPGSFQGFWELSAPDGDRFSLGKNADQPFWVQINVTSGPSSAVEDLGEPDWVETFNTNTSRYYLGSDDDVSFEIEDGSLVMTAFTASGDQWRVAQNVTVADFYIEAQFHTGDACSGEDSYGMIVRAPDQADNFIDSGYVFVFSCAGKFRIYRMDNNSYQGLYNWTASAYILAGPDEINTMGIKALADQFELYANGQLVASFIDAAYQQGYYGLTIRAKNTADFQVQVDQVSFWNID